MEFREIDPRTIVHFRGAIVLAVAVRSLVALARLPSITRLKSLDVACRVIAAHAETINLRLKLMPSVREGIFFVPG